MPLLTSLFIAKSLQANSLLPIEQLLAQPANSRAFEQIMQIAENDSGDQRVKAIVALIRVGNRYDKLWHSIDQLRSTLTKDFQSGNGYYPQQDRVVNAIYCAAVSKDKALSDAGIRSLFSLGPFIHLDMKFRGYSAEQGVESTLWPQYDKALRTLCQKWPGLVEGRLSNPDAKVAFQAAYFLPYDSVQRKTLMLQWLKSATAEFRQAGLLLLWTQREPSLNIPLYAEKLRDSEPRVVALTAFLCPRIGEAMKLADMRFSELPLAVREDTLVGHDIRNAAPEVWKEALQDPDPNIRRRTGQHISSDELFQLIQDGKDDILGHFLSELISRKDKRILSLVHDQISKDKLSWPMLEVLGEARDKGFEATLIKLILASDTPFIFPSFEHRPYITLLMSKDRVRQLTHHGSARIRNYFWSMYKLMSPDEASRDWVWKAWSRDANPQVRMDAFDRADLKKPNQRAFVHRYMEKEADEVALRDGIVRLASHGRTEIPFLKKLAKKGNLQIKELASLAISLLQSNPKSP